MYVVLQINMGTVQIIVYINFLCYSFYFGHAKQNKTESLNLSGFLFKASLFETNHEVCLKSMQEMSVVNVFKLNRARFLLEPFVTTHYYKIVIYVVHIMMYVLWFI